MITYWCTKKNSMKDLIEKGIDFNPALLPCLKADCDRWDNGEYFYIRKTGRRDESRQDKNGLVFSGSLTSLRHQIVLAPASS
jgi:hypothetical protein